MRTVIVKEKSAKKAKRSVSARSARAQKKLTRARRTETIKFLTLDETGRLFAWITEKRDKAILLIAYRHGLRASEIGLLRTSDLDLKLLRIMLHRLKGSLSGEHPLQADEARALTAWLKSRGTDSPILFPSRRGLPISRQISPGRVATIDGSVRETVVGFRPTFINGACGEMIESIILETLKSGRLS